MKILKIFSKDIELFKNLNTRIKKYFIYYSIFFILLFYYKVIKVEKIWWFLCLSILLLIYKCIMECYYYYVIDNDKLEKFLKERDNTNILKLLLFIQKWRNPLLLIFLYIDKAFLQILRSIIYYLKDNKYFDYTSENLKKIFWLQYFFFNLILGPLKFILGIYYNILDRIIKVPFSLFFLIRSVVLIFGVLVFWDFVAFIYKNLGFLFIYICLICWMLLIKKIGRDFKYLKIQYMTKFLSIDYLIFMRNKVSIIGLSITILLVYKKKPLNIKFLDDLSYLFYDKHIEETFYKYWEYYKRIYWLFKLDVWKEIKNRPSFYIYLNLINWIELPTFFTGPNNITDILFIKYKIEKLNWESILSENIKEDINFLYEIEYERLKLLLFMVWDIDNYIDNKNWNYITYVYDGSSYYIKTNNNIYDYMDIDNYKVEKNEKDLLFYDPENNMEFFNQLYSIIGVPPLWRDPLEITEYSSFQYKYMTIYNNLWSTLNNNFIHPDDTFLEETWLRDEESGDRDIKGVSKIENKIRDWIVLFLKEARKEWEESILHVKLEERNWSMLNNIKNKMLEYKKNDENE